MIYALFFTFIFSYPSQADTVPIHMKLRTNGPSFKKLKKCYQDLNFSDNRLNTNSRFLRDFFSPGSSDPSKSKKYQTLIIPEMINGKPVVHMFQPGIFRTYPYGDTKVKPYDKKNAITSNAPVGSECELEQNFPLRWDHPKYKYLSFDQNHPHFNDKEDCKIYDMRCKQRSKAYGYRMQLYTDNNGTLQFCEDELKTGDFGSKSSNKGKGWHINENPKSMNSEKAFKIISNDIFKKISTVRNKLKTQLSKNKNSKGETFAGLEDLSSSYRAASKSCKGFSKQIDQLARDFESELLSHDPKLKDSDGSILTNPNESEN